MKASLRVAAARLHPDRKSSHPGTAAVCALMLFGCVACSGQIDSGSDGPGSNMPPVGPASGGTPSPGGGGGVDVNRVSIHRLNNREYDNTVRDLLGVASTPSKTFIDDESALGFDTIADALGITPAQFEQYFNAADALVEQAFTDASLRQRVMTCVPASAADAACLKQIVNGFGLRAWRRPLADAETTRLMKVATDAMSLGEDGTGGVKQVVKTILGSLPFLYRIERDPDPTSSSAHPLTAYELATRLSYLAWATMPDDKLFSAAQSGDLTKTPTLSAELDRLLADPRAQNFVSSFAGQWLGMRDLLNHQVDASAFPAWNEQLRQSMAQEGYLYFLEFFQGGRPMKDFLTADVNFVNAPLAKLYGIAGSSNDTPMKVTNSGDARHGFLGLASFLTLSSFSYRTSPTLRGKWVEEYLLCETQPAPPAMVPDLDNNGSSSAAQSQNVRARLEAHRANPQCAACHAVLDPIGLGLENFDGIGRYRTQYANGDAIDSSGVLPDGATFKNLDELTAILSRSSDTRLVDCASKVMMTYALSRAVVPTDEPYLQKVRQSWAGGSLSALLKQLVLNDTFRFRRGEAM